MESKFTVDIRDDKNELIISEGSSAIGTIGIIGEGKKPIAFKEIEEAIAKDSYNKFLDNVEYIKEIKNPDMKIIMTEDTKERLIGYAESIGEDISDCLDFVLTVSGIHSNEMTLGITSKHDFEGDILNSISLDERKLFIPEDGISNRVHHCGKYTKKRKYRKKKKK